MKKQSFLIILLSLLVVEAQASENPFTETFNGMFNAEPIVIDIASSDGPPPPVPLDGGVTALLIAGGAAGYRQYKKKKR